MNIIWKFTIINENFQLALDLNGTGYSLWYILLFLKSACRGIIIWKVLSKLRYNHIIWSDQERRIMKYILQNENSITQIVGYVLMIIQSMYWFWQDAWQEHGCNMQNLTLVSKELQIWLQKKEKLHTSGIRTET